MNGKMSQWLFGCVVCLGFALVAGGFAMEGVVLWVMAGLIGAGAVLLVARFANSEKGTGSLKSSAWRVCVFVVLVVGMMAMGRGASACNEIKPTQEQWQLYCSSIQSEVVAHANSACDLTCKVFQDNLNMSGEKPCYEPNEVITEIIVGGWNLQEKYVGNCTIQQVAKKDGTVKADRYYPGGCFCSDNGKNSLTHATNELSITPDSSLATGEFDALLLSFFKMNGVPRNMWYFSSPSPSDISSESAPSLWRLSEWLSEKNPCDWQGVTCDDNKKHVIRLSLNGKSLAGGVPSELGTLTALTVLNLSDNQLTGNVPPELGDLNKLQELYLNNNSLTGSLPLGLTNIPVGNFEFYKLWTFFYKDTYLCEPDNSGFKGWLDKIPWNNEGEVLDCNFCESSTVPEEECEALLKLYSSTNGNTWGGSKVTVECDKSLYPLCEDQEVWKTYWSEKKPVCDWEGVKCEGGHVTEINLTHSLSGVIPAELGDLAKLKMLNLGDHLSGNIPPELGNLKKLKSLDLDGNHLSGRIPARLANLTELDSLLLFKNRLCGEIPEEFASLAPNNSGKLTTFPVFENHLNTVDSNGSVHIAFNNNEGWSWEDQTVSPTGCPALIEVADNFCITGTSNGNGYSWKFIPDNGSAVGNNFAAGISTSGQSSFWLMADLFGEFDNSDLMQGADYTNTLGSCFRFINDAHLWVGEYGEEPDCQITSTNSCTFNPTIRLVKSSPDTVLSITQTSHDVTGTSDTITFDVANVGTGTGPMGWVAEANDSWLTIESGDYGENSGTVTVRYDANSGEERTGTITVVAPGAENGSQTVEIEQAEGGVCQANLSVNPAVQDVSSEAGTISVNISTNECPINWTAQTDADWLTINSATGTNDGTITVNYTANPGVARTGTITVTAPSANNSPQTVEVRQAAYISLSGTVWHDINGDGVRQKTGDEAEPLLPGITVQCANLTGGIFTTQTTQTDEEGNYRFVDSITSGQHIISVIGLTGIAITKPQQPYYDINLTAGQQRTGLDFGVRLPASISGTVWNDLDCDGEQDTGEPGLDGWNVWVKYNNMDDVKFVEFTDENGNYKFEDLYFAGLYEVWVEDNGADRSFPIGSGSHSFNLNQYDVVTGKDFGYCIEAGQFSITPTAGLGGTISPADAVTVDSGAGQTFTITPDTCYTIADVLVDASSVGAVSSYIFGNVTENHTIKAVFSQKNFTITATPGTGGAISPSGNVTVACGEDRKFTITPVTGYKVEDVLIDGASVGDVTSHTFTNIASAHTIEAVFAADTFTVNFTVEGNGTLTGEASQSVEYGKNSTEMTAVPDESYEFTGWSGDHAGTVNPLIVENVTSDMNIIANFARHFELSDAILILKMLTGMEADGVSLELDANGNGKVGMEDVVCILQIVAEIRSQ